VGDGVPLLTASKLSVAEGTQAYARLRAEVIEAGILDRSYTYFIALFSLIMLGFWSSLAAIYWLNDYLLLTLACLAFSFFSVQVAGVNHDAGHRAVFKSARLNNVLGLFCSMLVGIVFDNWRTRHNAHHAYSNLAGVDPDLEIPLIATDEATYAAKGGVQRVMVRYQAWYFYGLGAIVSFSNRLGSMSYFLRRSTLRDMGRFGLYFPAQIVLFVLPFVLFDPVKALIVFGLVHVSSGIYLAACFAPNHKGMPVVGAGVEMSFIEQQVVTSRNVRGGLLTDIMLVGLNWQTEHHLFPATPRNKLPLIAPLLQQTCKELGLVYTSCGFIETNRAILKQLAEVGRYARSPRSGERSEAILVGARTAAKSSEASS
jgi:fatty acid desaturase